MNSSLITAAALPVSQIGLGCVTFGREIDEVASHSLLDHAIAHDVRLFDTAAAYGQGASEGILGRWLATRRPEGITIATKIPPPYGTVNVDDSLKRLAVRQIDLLYLHQWHATAEELTTLAALDNLVRSGKVRALGASNFNQAQLQSTLALQQRHGLARFSVVQNNHNLAVSDVSAEFRAFCAEQGLAIIAYSPLGAGFLTGKHQSGVQKGSRFDVVPGHQDVYFHESAYRRLARLEVIAARAGQSQTHLALAWALRQPGIASVLVGGRTPAHLDQALAALTFDDAALLCELTS
jgi:1-deoxyxylulose-5-phosphate synthase